MASWNVSSGSEDEGSSESEWSHRDSDSSDSHCHCDSDFNAKARPKSNSNNNNSNSNIQVTNLDLVSSPMGVQSSVSLSGNSVAVTAADDSGPSTSTGSTTTWGKPKARDGLKGKRKGRGRPQGSMKKKKGKGWVSSKTKKARVVSSIGSADQVPSGPVNPTETDNMNINDIDLDFPVEQGNGSESDIAANVEAETDWVDVTGAENDQPNDVFDFLSKSVVGHKALLATSDVFQFR